MDPRGRLNTENHPKGHKGMLSLCRRQKCIPLAKNFKKRYASKNARLPPSEPVVKAVFNAFNTNADPSAETNRKAMMAMKELVEPLESFTKNMIETSARRLNTPLHDNAVDIWTKIPQVDKQPQIPSLEKSQFLEALPQRDFVRDFDGVLADPASSYCRPGTFVELRRYVLFRLMLQYLDI